MAGYIGSAASVVSSGAENKKAFTITGATTSLTGLNYTVNKVHVFQNGVRLVDGTDYTATNGTTITLTVAAQSGDNVVVISQASYQVALSGIDDQSNAVAMTIDSNENVFIGKTSAGSATGVELAASGQVAVTRDGAVPAFFRRNTSDGSFIDFNKDGTAVGSIGIQGTGFYIDGEVEHAGIRFGGSAVVPRHNNAGSNNYVNLGDDSNRFKDAYIGGGIYLGGTGAANKLEDYEEGTWTAVDGSGNAYNPGANATYTKIGRIVYINFDISATASTSGHQIAGLPFTASPTSVTANWSVYGGYSTSNADLWGHINASTNVIGMFVGHVSHTLNGRWIGAGFYYTEQ